MAFSVMFATVFSAVTLPVVNKPTGNSEYFAFFVSTTTSATSTEIMKIAGAKKVDFYFSRGNVVGLNTGTSTFRVQVSPDGTNWYDFWKLAPATSTASTLGNVAHLGYIDIKAATSTVYAPMDLTKDAFNYVRCIVQEGVDGDHTCRAYAEY